MTLRTRLASSTPIGGTARWVTTDRCGQTSIRVYAGTVQVRDLKTGKTVTVKAGQTRRVTR